MFEKDCEEIIDKYNDTYNRFLEEFKNINIPKIIETYSDIIKYLKLNDLLFTDNDINDLENDISKLQEEYDNYNYGICKNIMNHIKYKFIKICIMNKNLYEEDTNKIINTLNIDEDDLNIETVDYYERIVYSYIIQNKDKPEIVSI